MIDINELTPGAGHLPQTTQNRNTMPRPTKVCPQCGGVFRKRSDQSAASWDAQVHCSRWCAGQTRVQARIVETKPCAECGRVIERTPSMTERVWRIRRYCSLTCSNAFARRSGEHLCACGQPPTTSIYFEQLTADGLQSPGELRVCADCAAYMLENDPGASVTPFAKITGRVGWPAENSIPAADTMPKAILKLRAYTR